VRSRQNSRALGPAVGHTGCVEPTTSGSPPDASITRSRSSAPDRRFARGDQHGQFPPGHRAKTASGDPTGVSPSIAAPAISPSAWGCRSNTCPMRGRANWPTRPAAGVWDSRPDRRRAAAGPEDPLHRRLLRDRGDLSGNRQARQSHRSPGVDQPGKRVAVTARSAYCLWLENNLKHAQLLQFDGADAALKQCRRGARRL